MPPNKDIIYPIFLECSAFAADGFWENIFEELAYGKTPYGTYISKDFLCCRYKNKDFSYKIERKDTKLMYDEIYALLTKKVGIMSHKEKVKKRKDFKDIGETMKDARQNWSDIRKKNTKELLIELFVTRMKKKHRLTIQQARYLLSAIFIGMVFKVITAKDIDFDDGKITRIDGIDFKNSKIIITKDLYQIETSFSPQIVIDKNLMSDSWNKYLKDLKRLSEK